jgi:hypothetical protein
MQRTAIALAVFLSACMAESAHGPAYNQTTAGPDATTCQDEKVTGSAIAREVCRSPEQRREDEMAKRSWMNRYPANPMVGDFTYPGLDTRHPRD